MPVTSMPSGRAAVSGLGQRLHVDGLGELDVEVLGVALVAHRQGQAEAHLGPGREPEAEGQRQLLDAERPLEVAGDVAVRDEADLALLGEPDADRKARVAPHGAG